MAVALGYHQNGTKATLRFHLQADSYDTASLIECWSSLTASTLARSRAVVGRRVLANCAGDTITEVAGQVQKGRQCVRQRQPGGWVPRHIGLSLDDEPTS
jgi:hypothetical protein